MSRETLSRSPAVVSLVCGVLSLGLLAVVTAVGETPATLPSPGEAAWWVAAAALSVQAASLTWARTRPVPALLGVGLPIPVMAVAGALDATSLTSLAVVAGVYLAASAHPVRGIAWPLAVVAAAMAIGGIVVARDLDAPWYEAVGGPLAQGLGTVGLTLLAATWMTARRETREARADQVRALAREQEALVQAAIARERADMARELHDIAAHHLTGIAVLAAAVERQIDTDPGGAKQAVHQVRDQTTVVLRDLRSLVGLLRDGDTAAEPRPETLAGVAHLVADVTATGRQVGLTVLGDADAMGREVGPLAQLAAYRAVQEALANAGRHAPGAVCEVTVDARPADAVQVTVRNGPGTGRPERRGGTGFGLLGMHERAQLTGAQLEAGPTNDGGWQVTMRLPRETT
ncbi:sensor histidine kinase [Nocardioides ferulae]|uniref:sensor histidine kinase n=1 Tax=Nocardioides ferulae TaxID=2340821 RepID=UPI000EAE4D28|nr:histidine kinase [Nocardioides ferulae]